MRQGVVVVLVVYKTIEQVDETIDGDYGISNGEVSEVCDDLFTDERQLSKLIDIVFILVQLGLIDQ